MVGNEEREQREREGQERSRCQIGHVPGKPPSSSCAEPPKEMVDGFLLCEGHALELKLEGQIRCWEEMLFHIDLWSGEATRRDREDVARLLEVERERAIYARHRAHEDLDALISGETPRGEVLARGEELLMRTRRDSLPLPPGGARPLSLGLRRLRRR
jgi:hypothetical protein